MSQITSNILSRPGKDKWIWPLLIREFPIYHLDGAAGAWTHLLHNIHFYMHLVHVKHNTRRKNIAKRTYV